MLSCAGPFIFALKAPASSPVSLLNTSLDFHIPISSFMGKMVFSEENGDFWGGFYQGRESLEAVHLRAVEGKTARSEPDIGAGCGARTSETLKRNSQRTFSPSFDS